MNPGLKFANAFGVQRTSLTIGVSQSTAISQSTALSQSTAFSQSTVGVYSNVASNSLAVAVAVPTLPTTIPAA